MDLHPPETGLLRGWSTGAAWLSSARVVRCWVKSRNERTPCPVLLVSPETVVHRTKEGGDDVKSAWPLHLGRHTRYNGQNSRLQTRKGEPSLKAGLSADRGLQPAHVKLESLVIVDQPRHGEYVPGPCTHRPSRHGSGERLKSVGQLARGAAAEGGLRDWDEVVTR